MLITKCKHTRITANAPYGITDSSSIATFDPYIATNVSSLSICDPSLTIYDSNIAIDDSYFATDNAYMSLQMVTCCNISAL